MLPPCITLEEHFLSDHISTDPSSHGKLEWEAMAKIFPPRVLENIYDLGDRRIRDMDQGSVTRQVISHAPLQVLAEEECRVRKLQATISSIIELFMTDCSCLRVRL